MRGKIVKKNTCTGSLNFRWREIKEIWSSLNIPHWEFEWKIHPSWKNIPLYYLPSPRENPSVLISSYLVPILPLGPSPQKHSRAAYFVRESQQIQNKKSLVRVPYHKLLNNLAWSSLNEGYSVVFVRISSRFVRTFTTSGLVQPLNSVSEKLIHFSKAIFFLLHIDIVHEEPRGRFNTKFLLSKWFRHYFLITRRISNFLKAEKTVTTFR